MNHSIAQQAKGKTGFPAFATICILVLTAVSLPQLPAKPHSEPPQNCVFDPKSFEAGDTIAVNWYYGTGSESVPPSLSIELIYVYSGFEIDPESELSLDLTESWFCADGLCERDFWIDVEARELHLILSRTDSVAIGGHGLIARGGGIGVEIVDMWRLGREPVTELTLFPNPVSDHFQLRFSVEQRIEKISLCDLNGNVIYTFYPLGKGQKYDCSHLPNASYMLRIRTSEGVLLRRLLVLR